MDRGKKRGIGKWGGLSVLGLIFATEWMDGLMDWQERGCEGEIRGRPNCL